jgi:hypothetical protein
VPRRTDPTSAFFVSSSRAAALPSCFSALRSASRSLSFENFSTVMVSSADRPVPFTVAVAVNVSAARADVDANAIAHTSRVSNRCRLVTLTSSLADRM